MHNQVKLGIAAGAALVFGGGAGQSMIYNLPQLSNNFGSTDQTPVPYASR